MIAIMLRLVARPERRNELARHVRERMLGPTRQEPGCIRYRFYQDIEDPNAFSFVEHWESWDAFKGHIRAPHTGEFLAVLGDLIAEPPEAFFHEVASTRGLELVDETLNAASA